MNLSNLLYLNEALILELSHNIILIVSLTSATLSKGT
jgi:hypothetical protein